MQSFEETEREVTDLTGPPQCQSIYIKVFFAIHYKNNTDSWKTPISAKSKAEDNRGFIRGKQDIQNPYKLYNKILPKSAIQIKMLIKIIVANFS